MRSEKFKFLIQGLLFIIFGILFMMNPIVKVALFTLIVGIILVTTGVLAILDGLFRTKGVKYKLLRIFEGLIFGAFGLIFFIQRPAAGVLIIVYTVIWMMIALAIMNTAFVFRHDSPIRFLAIILNMLVIILGVQALFDPALAAAVFYWAVAFQLIFMGINHISLYFLLPDEIE